jgi:hypothetical protein
VQVRVDAVLDAHSRVGDVAEDIGREQHRPEEDHEMEHGDQRDRPTPRDRQLALRVGERHQSGVGDGRDDQRD